ncbi:MAG: DNA-binding protein AraC-type [Clostridiales bacterium]|nr:DNA-binding protein AraC-type [Clostridiales bacterium]
MYKGKESESKNTTILYGISKVEYGANGCTPYPMCVKNCANYLGQDVSIDFSMVSTGTAFRLTWDTTSWNGGNVDVIHTFDKPEVTYKLGVEALGREFHIITRSNTSCDVKFKSSNNSDKKNDFINFIKKQIDIGFPCIALGIIGPPEACIITGYRENGEILLGWNFFQDAIEFATDVKIDESGYFISSKWWENNDTIAVISIGEKNKPMISNKEIIENAIKVMTGRFDMKSGKTFAKGINAYDAWKKAILNEADFPQNAILPILAERLMCHGDAMDCLADGRNNAAIFMKKLSEEMKEHSDTCKIIEGQFAKVVSNIWRMADVLGGYDRNEKQMKNFAKTEIRQQLAVLIEECKIADNKALEALVLLSKSI